MEMNNLMLCTNFTLNWCDKYNPDKFDLFVIFNEAWGIPDNDLIKKVTDVVEDYLKEFEPGVIDDTDAAIEIMNRLDNMTGVDGWGFQIYFRS